MAESENDRIAREAAERIRKELERKHGAERVRREQERLRKQHQQQNRKK